MNTSKRTFNPLLSDTFRYQQSENADLDYNGNWGIALNGDTITASTWTVVDGDATLSNEANTTTTTTAFITGDPGEHVIVNKITTTAGLTDERTILLKITDNDVIFIDNDYGRC